MQGPRGAAATDAESRPLIEIGWMLDDRLDDVDREAATNASREVGRIFRDAFPEFTWRVPLEDVELAQGVADEPVSLLEAGSVEISHRRWDFAVVVAASDLRSYDLPSAVAVLSRPLGVVLLSTLRIDPRARRSDASREERIDAICRRLVRRATYLVGRLGGLPRRDPSSSDEERDRGELPGIDERDRARLRRELARVADERLEEQRAASRSGRLAFHLRAAWQNRFELLAHLRDNRWWEFPFRMGRLTTAAISALAILTLTSESWEVTGQLSGTAIAALALFAIVSTSAYILKRQGILSLHRSFRPSEQIVVSRIAAILFSLLGITTTYALVFAIALAAGALLFGPEFVAGWSGVAPAAMDWTRYVAQAGFTAGVAVLVSSLGASLEGEEYIRHVAYVDEEL